MALTGRLGVLTLLLTPGLFLLWSAIDPLFDGIHGDAAIPTQNYLVRQAPLPKVTYAKAAITLASTSSKDGNSQIFAAEAAMAAGATPKSQIGSLRRALGTAPANARGWMVLSDAYRSSDLTESANALGQSLLLAPYDYWLAGPRAVRAAELWPNLNSYDRGSALRQVVLLWEEPVLRPNLRILLETPEGVVLVNRAFATRPDELRDLNRWLSEQRRRDQWRF